jgi:hypothetical protein
MAAGSAPGDGQGQGQSSFPCSLGCFESEDGEEQVFVVLGGAPGGGDFPEAGLVDEPDAEATQRSQEAGLGAGPDLAGVLTECDVKDPVDWTSHCSLTVGAGLEEAFLGCWQLDTQAFPASGPDVDGTQLAALDTLQHGLA